MDEGLWLVQVMMVKVCQLVLSIEDLHHLDSPISCLCSVMVRNGAASTILSEDQDASILLPPSLFAELRNATESGVSFTFYETAALFPLPEDSPFNLNIGSHVIGAFVAGQNLSNLSEPVTIFLRLTQPVCLLCIVTVLCTVSCTLCCSTCDFFVDVELNKSSMCKLELYCCR